MRSITQAVLASEVSIYIIYLLFGGREKRMPTGFEHLNKAVMVIPVTHRAYYALCPGLSTSHVLTGVKLNSL